MPAIVFASITPSAGKSAIASAVARHLALSGRRVTASSELATALEDVDSIRCADTSSAKVARGRVGVFEGGSGSASDDVDLADALDAHIVLVARFGEDVVSAATGYGTRLAGVVWNRVPRYRKYDLKDACAELADAGVRCMGYVDEDRRMVAHSVWDIGDYLEAERVIEPNDADSLIETFLIGGLVLDWGPTYFDSEPSTIVVVRSGRPDVQISALQSEETRAVLMTGGGKPIDYVFYESRAKGIPLMVTRHDTSEVMSLLDGLPESSFAKSGKSVRMCELLSAGDVMANVTELTAAPATR